MQEEKNKSVSIGCDLEKEDRQVIRLNVGSYGLSEVDRWQLRVQPRIKWKWLNIERGYTCNLGGVCKRIRECSTNSTAQIWMSFAAAAFLCTHRHCDFLVFSLYYPPPCVYRYSPSNDNPYIQNAKNPNFFPKIATHLHYFDFQKEFLAFGKIPFPMVNETKYFLNTFRCIWKRKATILKKIRNYFLETSLKSLLSWFCIL